MSHKESNNWNLAIILVSVFLSCIAGWIMYAVKTGDKSLDLKASKKALIIISVVDVVLIILVVVLVVMVLAQNSVSSDYLFKSL